MADPEIPSWLKALPLAPEYRPTETEFADPIAFISRIEREAAAFGICKVIPPWPRPSKRFVLANLNRSLAKSPELGPSPAAAPSPEAAVFTTRHQELGSRRRAGPPPVHKQVWQSGGVYTLEQFEAKSRAFARTQLCGFKEVSPLLVEALFWKAAAEKPIYIEYANDVPGSGFGLPEDSFRHYSHRRNRKRRLDRTDGPKCPYPVTSGSEGRQQGTGERESTAGPRLSSSPWNLQVIARSPGSLTRFMPDEVPGVTSPMVYIGMLFSWFAWHVEDHELHSLNFLHTGSPKTWYAVPGEYAVTLEEIVRVQGYGGNMDRLAAFTMLGEKTTLLSPEVLVTSGVPCCRLVQNPGEYVVTFPRAYHVGFSHGFNCGEAANFATPQWLKVAKEAAVRRAAMNYLPMLSHQQLLYMLTMSFISRIPRELLPGVRSSRLRDRKKEEREILVKKAFLNDMMNENHLLCALLAKESAFYAVLWEPELLPSPCTGSQSFSSFRSLEALESVVDDQGREMIHCNLEDKISFDRKTGDCCVENALHEVTANLTSVPCNNVSAVETQKTACPVDSMSVNLESLEEIVADEDDLPYGLDVDSGSLACVSCGILGYPFMAIVQPSEGAWKEFFPVNYEEFHQKSGKPGCLNLPSCLPSIDSKLNSDDLKEAGIKSEVQGNLDPSCMLYPASSEHAPLTEGPSARCGFSLLNDGFKEPSSQIATTLEVRGGKVSRTISDHQVEPISGRMPHSSAISEPINSVNGNRHGHILRPVEHQLDKFNPLNEDSDFASNKGTKIDYSNGRHCCDQLKEFKESMHMKANAIAENDSSSMNFSGWRPIYETNRLFGAPVKKSETEINKKWDTFRRFLRPRIFCLQHALETQELLQRKGGANVLIICHSDYVKIKAHAISVAEEIGIKFKCKDVPLDNASPKDLDLINISIDDEEHKEQGEDWTSKLGLNLRYCVKLRKQSSANQERLPLALGAIFSDPFPVSVISNLKWRSRKSRTPYKVIGTIQSKPASDAKIEKIEPVMRNSDADSIREIQVYKCLKSNLSGMAKNYHGLCRKGTPKELGSSKEMIDRDIHISMSGDMHFLNEEVENNNTESLLRVPILTPENPRVHRDGWTTEKTKIIHDIDFAKSEGLTTPTNSAVEVCRSQLEIRPNELSNMATTVCDPVKSQYHQLYTKVSMFESSELLHGLHTSEESCNKCEFDDWKMSEFQADIVATEVESSEVSHHEKRVADEINSAHSFDKTIDSAYDSSAGRAVDYSEDLHEVPVAWAPNFEGIFCNSMFSDDQSVVPLSSTSTFEMQLVVSVVEEPKMDNTVSVVDSVLTRQEEASVARENNLQLESQSTEDVLIIDRSVMQQELYRASEMEENGKVNSSEMQQELRYASEVEENGKINSTEMQQELHGASEIEESGKVVDSVKSSGHAVAGLMVESSGRPSQAWYSEEVNSSPTADNSAKPAATVPVAVTESSGIHEVMDTTMDANATGSNGHSLQNSAEKDNGKFTIVVYKSYVRRNKRKREAEHTKDGRDSCTAFVRGPCEGLRPRTERAAYERNETKTVDSVTVKATKRADHSAVRQDKVKKGKESYECDLEGCRMSFRTRGELLLHKRNRCTYKGCGKRFSSHQYTMRHQRVHDDERPLKCHWKGCNMSFKWAWARTEHLRLHTGERPYKCNVTGCGLTFRFVSDFSRHRRKTGHSVDSAVR